MTNESTSREPLREILWGGAAGAALGGLVTFWYRLCYYEQHGARPGYGDARSIYRSNGPGPGDGNGPSPNRQRRNHGDERRCSLFVKNGTSTGCVA